MEKTTENGITFIIKDKTKDRYSGYGTTKYDEIGNSLYEVPPDHGGFYEGSDYVDWSNIKCNFDIGLFYDYMRKVYMKRKIERKLKIAKSRKRCRTVETQTDTVGTARSIVGPLSCCGCSADDSSTSDSLHILLEDPEDVKQRKGKHAMAFKIFFVFAVLFAFIATTLIYCI